VVTDPWLAQSASNPQLAHPADDPEYNAQAVVAGLHSDSLVYDQSPILADLPPPLTASGETALHIKGLLLLQNMITCACQLVGQRLGGEHAVRLGLLLLEEALGLVAETPRGVSCLNERPHQVGVTVLGVSCTLFLTVGVVGTVDATGIGSEVANLGKAANVSGFQHDHDCQYLANTRDAFEQGIFGPRC